MSLEVQINGKTVQIEVIGKNGRQAIISVDGKPYDVDIEMVEEGVYSILHNGVSYNVELVENGGPKKYLVNTLYKSYNVEIIDAESKYLRSRKKASSDDGRVISSPMPGKVVSIPVKVGDKVKAGQTVIIVSAMKMESEYKVKKDRVVTEIHVKEGDTIEGHQPLITIE